MPVVVRIPEALLALTAGEHEVTAEGNTVSELFDDLDKRYPGIRRWAFDGEGALRSYVSVFVNRCEVDSPAGPSGTVSPGDYVSILPVIAGGAKTSRKLYLTFPQELIREPIIFRIGHEFSVLTNIRGASVSDNVGLVALEIEGEPKEIDRAVDWLKGKGVKVEPLPDGS
ncbi:MAG: MoaD/ThiS family protein [Verrucomicrobia bacterium]|nr:MoaD/ThiS family protein [Verrucomicrobiota bacterium]